MDISTFKPAESFLDIVEPNGSDRKIGVRISLVSIDDGKMKKLKRFMQDEIAKIHQRGKIVTAEKLDANENRLMFEAMTGWEWGNDHKGEPATFHGEKPTFNEENVLKVFNELPWFREQISKKCGETESFFTI